MKTALRDGVARLELTTRVTLAVLALASGVYTYLGVRDLLGGTGNVVFFAAVIYSVAVSIGIYTFWTFLMRFMPHVRESSSRALLFGTMLLGSVMIVAMSAWLNAAALAGSAAVQQHLAVTLQAYTRDLDQAHNNALASQSLLPDIQLASTRFARLADAERAGSLTGTAGSGTVVQLLTQMSTQLGGLSQEVTLSGERVKTLYEQGGKHLTAMREFVSKPGPINARSDGFAGEALSLMGVVAALQQTSVAPAVKRAADGLASGFIAPAASGRNVDLAERQTSVVGRVEAAVAQQAQALSLAADKILATKAVEPARFQPLSTAEAVLRYAGDFVPSWAGAISIDLMPAVLVLILCIVHAAIRREGVPLADASSMTAAEMLTALRLAREVEVANGAVQDRLVERDDAAPDSAVAKADPQKLAVQNPEPARPEPEEKVTPFAAAAARAAKKD